MHEDLRLYFYTRARCNLCDEALAVLEARRKRLGISIEIRDVDADPTWLADYGDQVPVGVLDGRRVFKYRVDPTRLEAAVRARRAARTDAEPAGPSS